jgi:hypothetical protein
MRTVKYEEEDKGTGSTETLIAVDEAMSKKFGNLQRAYNEGFAASDGVRGGTAETNGRVLHPEKSDDAETGVKSNSIEDENPGLADN